MTAETITGVVPILVTPFDDADRIDEESLAAIIEHNIAAGVHGLGLAVGSEIFKLTEAERARLSEVTAACIAGRVPLIINVSAPGTDLAVHYARMAEAAGADALMVMPPWFMPVGVEGITDYFDRICSAVPLPLILQDIIQAPVPAALALSLADRHETIRYVKVETPPVTPRVAQMVEAVGDRLVVFGGAGGGYFIEELRRGAQGTMPFCTRPQAWVEIWDRFRAGDETGARAVFDDAFTALNRLSVQNADIFYHVHKQLLHRQGLIRTARVRSPTVHIDAVTRREIDTLLAQILPEPKPFG